MAYKNFQNVTRPNDKKIAEENRIFDEYSRVIHKYNSLERDLSNHHLTRLYLLIGEFVGELIEAPLILNNFRKYIRIAIDEVIEYSENTIFGYAVKAIALNQLSSSAKDQANKFYTKVAKRHIIKNIESKSVYRVKSIKLSKLLKLGRWSFGIVTEITSAIFLDRLLNKFFTNADYENLTSQRQNLTTLSAFLITTLSKEIEENTKLFDERYLDSISEFREVFQDSKKKAKNIIDAHLEAQKELEQKLAAADSSLSELVGIFSKEELRDTLSEISSLRTLYREWILQTSSRPWSPRNTPWGPSGDDWGNKVYILNTSGDKKFFRKNLFGDKGFISSCPFLFVKQFEGELRFLGLTEGFIERYINNISTYFNIPVGLDKFSALNSMVYKEDNVTQFNSVDVLRAFDPLRYKIIGNSANPISISTSDIANKNMFKQRVNHCYDELLNDNDEYPIIDVEDLDVSVDIYATLGRHANSRNGDEYDVAYVRKFHFDNLVLNGVSIPNFSEEI